MKSIKLCYYRKKDEDEPSKAFKFEMSRVIAKSVPGGEGQP